MQVPKQIALVPVYIFAGILVALAIKSVVGTRDGELNVMVPLAEVGDVISLPIEPPANRVSVVLAVSEQCDGCEYSREFYERFMAACATNEVPVILVGPSGAQEKYIPHRPDVTTLVLETYPRSVGFIITPTIVVINRSGTIRQMFEGKLTTAEEESALNGVADDALEMPFFEGNIHERLWDSWLSKQPWVVLVDGSEREDFAITHRGGAVNIPFGELEMRARHELDQDKVIALDCSRLNYTACESAKRTLNLRGFGSVVILNAGWYDPRCIAEHTGHVDKVIETVERPRSRIPVL